MDRAPLVIGIAGGTGSGKTTVAERIRDAMPSGSTSLLRHDFYYRDHPELDRESLARVNFDHPEALETSLLVEHLRALKSGQSVATPVYDFAQHRRSSETVEVVPTAVIIVEGILTFVDPALRDELDIRIYVDTDADIRLMRRIRRDLQQRGRDFGSVRQQYYETVRPMHLEYVEPSKRHAHLIVPEGGQNEVAIGVILARLLAVVR